MKATTGLAPIVSVLTNSCAGYHLKVFRDAYSSAQEKRLALRVLAFLVISEAMRSFRMKETTVRTRTEDEAFCLVPDIDITVMPIMRAGLEMVDPALELFPRAQVVHHGSERYRDPTTGEIQVRVYYDRKPAHHPGLVLITDPMQASLVTLHEAIATAKSWGAKDVRVAGIIAAPDRIAAFNREHPDVPIHVAALDRCLNDHCYILPGCGDAGDNIYNTATDWPEKW